MCALIISSFADFLVDRDEDKGDIFTTKSKVSVTGLKSYAGIIPLCYTYSVLNIIGIIRQGFFVTH